MNQGVQSTWELTPTYALWRAYAKPAATHHVWQPGAPVAFAPLTDFWIPRLRLELAQRFGLALEPA